MEKDAENFMYFTTMGGYIRMKKDAVPHKFDCQVDRKRTAATIPGRPSTLKRLRKELVAEAMDSQKIHLPSCSKTPSTETQVPELDSNAVATPINEVLPPVATNISYKHVGVQVKPSYRSKFVSCKINPVMETTASSPIKCISTKDAMSSPIRVSRTLIYSSSTDSSSENVSENDNSTDYDVQEESECELADNKKNDDLALKMTNIFIERAPKKYIGIVPEWYWVVNFLVTKTGISDMHIKLILMKLKLNDTFERLGDNFGMSSSNASRIFKKHVPILSHFLKTLICWPEKRSIKRSLPIPFRARYSNVVSIIDCFEIQIEKPSDPIMQALTWSEYKKCNTLKYLVSSTPDGLVNFISSGFGGRTTDVVLFEKCGFLNMLPKNCDVMADRGFKHIAKLINDKECTLIRPPSVSVSEKPTKQEVLESKRIASLRIHIERVIRRFREFEFLKPHAVINRNLVSSTDDVVIIVAALINLQPIIIKT